MPTLKIIGAYRLEMHTGHEAPPPHVHVVRQGRDLVVNLLLLEPYGTQPFRVAGAVWAYLRAHQAELLRMWDEYHGR